MDNGNITTLLAGENEIYQTAIRHIKYSFSENARGVFQNHSWSIVLAVNSKFFTAIKQAEPMALLIAFQGYILVLFLTERGEILRWRGGLDPMGNIENPVKEISEMLQHTSIAQVPDGLEAIAWARAEVGFFWDVWTWTMPGQDQESTLLLNLSRYPWRAILDGCRRRRSFIICNWCIHRTLDYQNKRRLWRSRMRNSWRCL